MKEKLTLKRSIRFIPERRKLNGKLIEKNIPIRGVITYNGNRIFFTTGVRCDVNFNNPKSSKWDFDKERVKPNTVNFQKQSATYLNNILTGLARALDLFFTRCELKRITPTKRSILETVAEVKGSTQKHQGGNSVDELFQEFINDESTTGAWSLGTYKKVKTIKAHLYEFDKSLTIDDLDEDVIKKFMAHLLKKKDMRDSTINKAVKIVKWFCRWAHDKGHLESPDILKFRPKYKVPKNDVIVFLTWDELMNIYTLDVKGGERVAEARDAFALSCFTGLRYSDIKNLKKSDIKENEITVTTKKTSATLHIELNKYSREILDRYKDTPGDLALPVADNGEMNERLKLIGEMAELKEPITKVYYQGGKRMEETQPKSSYLTFHVGRRTFITLSLYLGIPAEIIMKWTGHADFATMKPYLAIVDEMKKNEMGKWDK